MEELFPFLIGLALFAYKIYSNFKSEQDKARKRDVSKPVEPSIIEDWVLPETRAKYDRPAKTPKQPEPFLVEETLNPANPYEPKYKHLYKEQKAEAPAKEHIQREFYQPEINIEKPADEVIQSRKIHEPHRHKLEKVNHDEELPHVFDMRDAIIKQAILNRPSYL